MEAPRQILLETVQSSIVRSLFESLKDILQDCNMCFTPQGATICAMDGAHVALVNMNIQGDMLERYECESLTVIGLNIATMIACLKPIGSCDTLRMEVFTDKMDIMKISITNSEKKRLYSYDVKLIDIDCDMLDIPDKQFPCVITLPSSDMQHIVRDLHCVGDKIRVESSDHDLFLSATGDHASLRVQLSQSVDGVACTNQEDTSIDNTYSAKYFSFFSKASNLSNWVEIYLSQDYPMTIKYNVASIGYLQFCLAPCIEE
tara:strand:+ start:1093 stop:1872 length:780 start_codon:yes stop_codon:yes gene_type:complete